MGIWYKENLPLLGSVNCLVLLWSWSSSDPPFEWPGEAVCSHRDGRVTPGHKKAQGLVDKGSTGGTVHVPMSVMSCIGLQQPTQGHLWGTASQLLQQPERQQFPSPPCLLHPQHLWQDWKMAGKHPPSKPSQRAVKVEGGLRNPGGTQTGCASRGNFSGKGFQGQSSW